jgi:hypothetical protein
MSSVPRVCYACGAASAWDAKFCQHCGRRLEEDEKGPRYFGALSPGPAFILGCILLAAALLALIAGSLIAAVVFLALAAVAFVFFYDAARRYPDDSAAQRVLASGQHVRGWLTFSGVSLAAWTRALRDVVRLRRESRRLRREREPTLRSLGDASYREDEPMVQELRERVRVIDEELARRDEARAEAVAAARRHVDEERAAATSTQQFTVDELTSSEHENSERE